ncbi:hypothetical protein PybrP1_012933 [[Pythium] brassicae (nom. inval.)]|nr:hypothetical protein PybrP1_012933 [[Pythium] brassicae (nom. inval.)]
MALLRQPKNAAELARFTDLRSVRANATRWSSTSAMIDRYMEIRDVSMHVTTVGDHVPRGAACRHVQALHAKLFELDRVCKKLQDLARIMSEVRAMFDAVFAKHPTMPFYLSGNADIVHPKAFETAAVKHERGTDHSLDKERAIASFREAQEADMAGQNEDDEEGFAS